MDTLVSCGEGYRSAQPPRSLPVEAASSLHPGLTSKGAPAREHDAAAVPLPPHL